MKLKLISHVNADADLIEAWLNYYLQIGIDRFHLIVHGPPEENEKLFDIKASYPITIEDMYEGPFDSDQKKSRLDALLARSTDQWVILVDSDEFVEFPYRDIPETIKMLSHANANVMAAPMLQRLTGDGTLETPPLIENPFEIFTRCSTALYWRMGIKAEIFKFPLFYCVKGTRVLEEGNHNPPLGDDPRISEILGATHHFKFRHTISQRLLKRIKSAHSFRGESVQFQEYLDAHSNRLPLEGSFEYSREELFRRGLLKQLRSVESRFQWLDRKMPISHQNEKLLTPAETQQSELTSIEVPATVRRPGLKEIMFILPEGSEAGGLEKHVLEIVRGLLKSQLRPVIVCFERDIFSAHLDRWELAHITVQCLRRPDSFLGWLRMIREANPAVIVFCYSWIEAFSWQSSMAALLAGVRRRFSIQYRMPIPVPPPEPGKSLGMLARRLIGQRTRRLLTIRISGLTPTKTVCVSNAVHDALVNCYGFPSGKTITIYKGVSTSFFSPCKSAGEAQRTLMGIGPRDFVLVCVARLAGEAGIEILIHALSRVLRQGIECKCIIVGHGPLEEELIRKTNTLGISNWVFFEGPQKDVRAYLRAGSAFIVTSSLGDMPISILEALACGLPCIVSDVGGIREVIEEGEVGLVIPPSSVEAAELAIVYLATHPSEVAEMARKARDRVCRNFEADNRIDELNAVLLS
jgi:glycosyltransferase involved in cell wall biosynthesis